MIAVSSADGVRALDARAIQGVGVPGPVLMENAGRLATGVLLDRWGDAARHGGVLVLCGKGNNGGDGYVVARHLHLAGVPVAVCGLDGRHAPDAERNRYICQRLGLAVDAPCRPDRYAVVVDAMLGTGLSSSPRGLVAAHIEAVNAAHKPVLAIDVPTGLDSDSGIPLGATVRADVTVTFGRLKAGFFLEPGPDWCGEVVLADIGLAVAERWSGEREGVPSLNDARPQMMIPEPHDVAAWLPLRPNGAHKGTSGHLAIVAGSEEKTGAAVLCANAAMRAGAGLVTLFLPRNAWSRLHSLRPEVMLEDLHQIEKKVLNPVRFQALAVGPGLGTAPAVRARCRALWAQAAMPAVFDADGINSLAGALRSSPWPRLLTPHPGEAGRLLGVSAAEVQRDRLGALRELARYAPVLLKGRHSLQSGKVTTVNPTGGPQLATAGSGDVLTGVIGALLARGLGPRRAGTVAAFVHGYAAELAGATPIVAGDIVDAIPAALRGVAGRGAVITQVGP